MHDLDKLIKEAIEETAMGDRSDKEQAFLEKLEHEEIVREAEELAPKLLDKIGAGKKFGGGLCKNEEHPIYIPSRRDGFCRECYMHRNELENRGWRFLFTLLSGIMLAYLIFS